MIKVIVAGAAGRMGGRIITLIHSDQNVTLVGAVEQEGHQLIGRDVGSYLGLGETGVVLGDDLAGCIEKGDVVIDFSNHIASVEHLRTVAEHHKAIVIGSTGLTQDEMEEVANISKNAKCVLAPNMSVGVNVMFRVLKDMAGILGDAYDVEIIEAHHNQKKDAPSGTAVKMAQIIAQALDRDIDKVSVYGRKGMIGARPEKEIGIHTVRAGDIVGEHTVLFGGMGERLEFTHRAHSRDNFARGAIRAAAWIVDRENGLYDMQDVLGLKD
ncbi:MAG TPA: 4-hydroxy-tetrahydrodipicolinate reductase [Syntrophales bacterium]|nr:4-hydroxy-tetrahydrodipicolinate reductase [Syntrophales bacterium]HPQ44390.1 4-hydroxy-tetrahydrodipicolinate reductase [Syntrophales bacterium]